MAMEISDNGKTESKMENRNDDGDIREGKAESKMEITEMAKQRQK